MRKNKNQKESAIWRIPFFFSDSNSDERVEIDALRERIDKMGSAVFVRRFAVFFFECLVKSRILLEADLESHVFHGNVRRH